MATLEREEKEKQRPKLTQGEGGNKGLKHQKHGMKHPLNKINK